jgi:hypothetical protein
MPAYGVSNGVHQIINAWWIHPQKTGVFMIDGNDGEYHQDGRKNMAFYWQFTLAQFYHINVR